MQMAGATQTGETGANNQNIRAGWHSRFFLWAKGTWACTFNQFNILRHWARVAQGEWRVFARSKSLDGTGDSGIFKMSLADFGWRGFRR
jgi:hypothetical protein